MGAGDCRCCPVRKPMTGHHIRLERCCAFGGAFVCPPHTLICINSLAFLRNQNDFASGGTQKREGSGAVSPQTGAVFQGSRIHLRPHCHATNAKRAPTLAITHQKVASTANLGLAPSGLSLHRQRPHHAPANQHLDRRLDGIDRLEGMAGAALVIGDALLVRRQSRAFPFDFQIATSVEKDAIAKMATQSGRHGARGAGAATTEARHDRGTPCRGCSK